MIQLFKRTFAPFLQRCDGAQAQTQSISWWSISVCVPQLCLKTLPSLWCQGARRHILVPKVAKHKSILKLKILKSRRWRWSHAHIFLQQFHMRTRQGEKTNPSHCWAESWWYQFQMGAGGKRCNKQTSCIKRWLNVPAWVMHKEG